MSANSLHADSLQKPRLALTLGDPAGVGPEIALAALADARVRAAARLVVVGPARFRPSDVPLVHVEGELDAARGVSWIDTGELGAFELGACRKVAGARRWLRCTRESSSRAHAASTRS